VLIGTFASVITLTSAMWLIQTGGLVFPSDGVFEQKPAPDAIRGGYRFAWRKRLENRSL
jgi:hypothetical protein